MSSKKKAFIIILLAIATGLVASYYFVWKQQGTSPATDVSRRGQNERGSPHDTQVNHAENLSERLFPPAQVPAGPLPKAGLTPPAPQDPSSSAETSVPPPSVPGDETSESPAGPVVPSTEVPPLVEPSQEENNIAELTSEGSRVRGKVKKSTAADESASPSILGTTDISDGVQIPASQDSVIPFSMVQDLARTLVNGYWPKGTHILASSSGIVSTSFSSLNTRYGVHLLGSGTSQADIVRERQRMLNYLLMPSMVDGLYALYAERFIRLVNYEAQTKVHLRNNKSHSLTAKEIAEMYRLYARWLDSTADCIRCYTTRQETRYLTEIFILAENEAQAAHMAYQEQVAASENAGTQIRQGSERQYRIKVAERERARENLAAAFRRFTDTRNMDTSDLVFLAKWLNRRPVAHMDGLEALATVLKRLSIRMEQEKERFLAL